MEIKKPVKKEVKALPLTTPLFVPLNNEDMSSVSGGGRSWK
jgi:hypothetical protein